MRPTIKGAKNVCIVQKPHLLFSTYQSGNTFTAIIVEENIEVSEEYELESFRSEIVLSVFCMHFFLQFRSHESGNFINVSQHEEVGVRCTWDLGHAASECSRLAHLALFMD